MIFERKAKAVTFITSCWEGDWKKILLNEEHMQKQMNHHGFFFTKKLLIVNNVQDEEAVLRMAKQRVKEGFFTEFFLARDYEKEALSFFGLKREAFKAGADKHLYEGVDDDWVYYNARSILCGIYLLETPYFLYQTGDVKIEKRCSWIVKAIRLMEKNPSFKVANLTWNDCYKEAKKESYMSKKGFYISEKGFSDQQFLGKKEDFRKPIYHEIRKDASHFPRGDVLEKRIFSYMKNHAWKRMIYKRASYQHE